MKKKQARKKLYKISIDLFDFDIYIYLSETENPKIIEKIFPKHNFTIEEGSIGKMYGYRLTSLIWCKHNKDKTTLIHEVSHAVDHLIDTVGIPPGWESTEVRANLIEYVYKKLLELKLI